MSDDIGRAAAMIADTYRPSADSVGHDGWDVPDADADVIAEFARLYRVRKGHTPDDSVAYYRPAYCPTGRDDLLLVVAVLDAYGHLVSPNKPHAAWQASIGLTRGLWLDQREWREVDQMAGALRAGLESRYEPSKRPARKPKKAKSEPAIPPVPAPIDAVTTPPIQGDTMPKTPDGAHKIAKEYARALRAAKGGAVGQWPVAFILLDDGEREYPDAKLPGGATWPKLRQATMDMIPANVREIVLRQIAPKPEPVAVPVPLPVVAQAAPEPVAVPVPVVQAAPVAVPVAVPVPVPVVQAAPVAVPVPVPVVQATSGLTIVHTVIDGTSLLGTRKGDGVAAIMGKDGLRWSWWGSGRRWYIRRSKEGGADMVKVRQAEEALRAHGYSVAVQVDNRCPVTGNELPPKVSMAEQQRRAAAYQSAQSSLIWHLSASANGLPCQSGGDCGTVGLTMRSARIIDVDGSPRVFCLPCAGGPVPEPVAVPVVQAPPEPVAVPVPAPVAVPVVQAPPEPVAVPVPAPVAVPVVQAPPEPEPEPVEVSLTDLLAEVTRAAEVILPPVPVAVPVVQAPPVPVAVPVPAPVVQAPPVVKAAPSDLLSSIPHELLIDLAVSSPIAKDELLRRLNGVVMSSAPATVRRPVMPKVAAPVATAVPSIVAVPPVATATMPTVPKVAAPVVTDEPVYPGIKLGDFLLDDGAHQKQTAKAFRSAIFSNITSKMLVKGVPADAQISLSVYVRDGLFTATAKLPAGMTVDMDSLSDAVRIVAGQVPGVVVA